MRGGGANSAASSKPKHKAKPRAQILKQGRGKGLHTKCEKRSVDRDQLRDIDDGGFGKS